MALRIKYNLKAFDAMRTTDACEDFVQDLATGYAAACGEGYEVAPAQKGRKRARRAVVAVTDEAKADNAANQTLLRNLPRR